MAALFRRKAKYRPPVSGDRIGQRIARFATRLLLALGILACAALLGWGGWLFYGFLFRSDFFTLEEISIQGANTQVERWIRSALRRKKLNAGNLLRLDTREIRETVEAIPKVKDAQVRKRYPDRVAISVTQRYPVALVLGDAILAVDEEGVAIEEVLTRNRLATEHPYVTGLEIGRSRLGERLRIESLTKALTLLSCLRERTPELFAKVSEAHFDERKSLTIVLKGGTEVRFGRDNPLAKMVRLETFIRELGPLEQYVYVDLRFDKTVSMPRSRPTQKADQP